MTEIFGGSIALILALSIWGLGKKPYKNLSKLSNKTFPNISNEETIQLVQSDPKQKITTCNQSEQILPDIPNNYRERIYLRKKLFKLINSGPKDRLLAVEMASKSGDKLLLPILRIGLKDFDSRIIIAAAKGIKKYREFPPRSKSQLVKRPPRNIFLMR